MILLVLLLASCDGNVEAICADLCTTLQGDCGFAAFPSLESCTQGCLYDAGKGADVMSLDACVQKADCDPFAVAMCDLHYGAGR